MTNNHKRLLLRPSLWNAQEAHATGQVRYDAEGHAHVLFQGQTVIVPPNKQFDMTQATIFGLNERLTMAATSPVINASGTTLRDAFNAEWEAYSEKLSSAEGPLFDYGYYAFYPERGELVRFCPPFWHHVVAVASSSMLLSDPDHKLTWREIRELFEHTTIAVAGCSVGSSVIHSAVMDMRPAAIKIADKSVYKLENINRVRLSYADIVKSQAERDSPLDLSLKNKSHVTTSQLYAVDPFINVFVYDEGITADTIDSFLGASDGEPQTDIVVEEVDDPRIKIFIREEARRRRLPLIMVTDIGSAVQLDVRRFDKNASLPLSAGIEDEELYKKMEAVYEQGGDRKVFFEFVDALIGAEYRQDELQRIIEERCEIPTSTIIPQLGSTVAMAGAIAAEAIARIRLGYSYPERVIINKRTFKIKIRSGA